MSKQVEEIKDSKDVKTSGGRCNNKTRSHNSRNKRRNNSIPKEYKSKTADYTDGNINNPSYYYEDATVLSQVMNFSFNQFGGVPFWLGQSVHNPMIAAYYLNPSLPETTGEDEFKMDGVTTAALRNFLALSGSNAKTTAYAPQDVILLMLAVAELLKVSTFIARAFGVAYLFNYRNRSYPETLLGAMGLDVEDFSKNLAQYRVRFNKLLAVASKIPFPADIPLFKKATDLYAYLYLDDNNSALAQTYMLCPNSVWVFNEEYNENGAGLETLDFIQPTSKMSDMLDRFETMITRLVNSTSLNTIYSDIMRLVQNGKINNLISFKPIDENFVVAPVYNEEVRDWLHNAMIMGHPVGTVHYPESATEYTNFNDVSCDAAKNKVLYHPQFRMLGMGAGTSMTYGMSGLIDFDHDNVTVEDKVRATRFTQRCEMVKNPDDGYRYTTHCALADEYIVDAYFYTGENPDTYDYRLRSSFLDSREMTAKQIADLAHTLSKFDWAPLIYLYTFEPNEVDILGDLDYYTELDFATIKRIYDYEIMHFLQLG